jgi:hypothetical protein
VCKLSNLHKNELNTTFFLFDETLKGSKSLKIFKMSLTFRFDKLSHLSKSVHTGENSQIPTVSNKKYIFGNLILHYVRIMQSELKQLLLKTDLFCSLVVLVAFPNSQNKRDFYADPEYSTSNGCLICTKLGITKGLVLIHFTEWCFETKYPRCNG